MREWTRRDFFRAAGIVSAGAALLPFVPIPSALACGALYPRCLVLFAHGNGSIPNRWTSNGRGAPFTDGGPLPVMQGPILAPLDRHRSSITLLDGLDLRSGMLRNPLPAPFTGNSSGHGRGHWGLAALWSGAQGIQIPDPDRVDRAASAAATIDQILAEGATTRRASLVLNTNYTSYYPENYVPAYSGPNAPVNPRTSPRAVFDDLFGAPVTGGTAATQRRRAERRSVFGVLRGELGRLRTELPPVDRERLDRHLEQVDALDGRLVSESDPVVCDGASRPTDPMYPPTYYGYNPAFSTKLNLHFDVIRLALACDLTRIINFMVEREHNAFLLTPETGDLAAFTSEHTVSHETFASSSEARRLQAVDVITHQRRALTEHFSGLLDRLNEGSGPTLLEETLVVWGSPMSWGGAHTSLRIPFVVASRHPSIQTNRYFRLGNKEIDVDAGAPNPHTIPSVSIPHNRLLTSIMHIMGRTDIERVGDVMGGQTLDNTPLEQLCARRV